MLTPATSDDPLLLLLRTSRVSGLDISRLKASLEVIPSERMYAISSFLNDLEFFELLIEVICQQQHGVIEFAFGIGQRTFAKIADHDCRRDRDCQNH